LCRPMPRRRRDRNDAKRITAKGRKGDEWLARGSVSCCRHVFPRKSLDQRFPPHSRELWHPHPRTRRKIGRERVSFVRPTKTAFGWRQRRRSVEKCMNAKGGRLGYKKSRNGEAQPFLPTPKNPETRRWPRPGRPGSQPVVQLLPVVALLSPSDLSEKEQDARRLLCVPWVTPEGP